MLGQKNSRYGQEIEEKWEKIEGESMCSRFDDVTRPFLFIDFLRHRSRGLETQPIVLVTRLFFNSPPTWVVGAKEKSPGIFQFDSGGKCRKRIWEEKSSEKGGSFGKDDIFWLLSRQFSVLVAHPKNRSKAGARLL